jgi:ABC-type Mn2+/Zn2+ transport system ATPase subunit
MEILSFPPIRVSIINSLESSLRILISNEFDDHLPMSRRLKGVGISKILQDVIFQLSGGKERRE